MPPGFRTVGPLCAGQRPRYSDVQRFAHMPTITLRLPDGASSALRVIARRQAATSARGDRVRIIPNHSCVVSNLADHAWSIDGREATALGIAAGGRIM